MTQFFKTNIRHHLDAIKMKEILLKEFPATEISFNLEADKKTLRIEGKNVPYSRVIQSVKMEGFYCELIGQDL